MKDITLIHGDCLEEMKKIPAKSIDLVLTDPPYGIKYINANRKEKFDKIELDDNLEWLNIFFREIKRLLKDNSHLYVFSPQKNLVDFLVNFKKYFKQQNILAVKQKHCSGLYNPYAFRHSWETVIFGTNGKRKLNKPKLFKTKRWGKDPRQKNEYKTYFEDFIDYYHSNEFNLNLKHPTQKSIEINKFFIQLSTKEGDIIFDPFMGSGTTAIACKELHRKFIGIEINKDYYEIAKKRIANTNPTFF